ncbi:MAG: DinB family protein [Saprospiraceae bacterium]
MTISKQIAKHFREVYFGGNWTVSNFKDQLNDVSWQHAVTKVYTLNTIVTLVYHSSYFASALLGVLQGEALNAKDKYSFDHPPINSQEDWEKLLNKVWSEAESTALLIEQLKDGDLNNIFVEEKYGNYYRNLHGIIEHLHYHLGQIVLIKKILMLVNE